jgi:hypothetical protein
MNHEVKFLFVGLIVGVLVIGGVAFAGFLIPATESPAITYASLQDIFDKLTTGATTTEKSFNPTGDTETSTMVTLTQIFEAIPEWLTLDNSTTTVLTGYYEAIDLVTVEEDLVADNIIEGVNIFGIEGSFSQTPPVSLEWSTHQIDNADFDTAVSTCAGTVDGSPGWRLPTYPEFVQKYVDVDGVSFTNHFNYYWTSTTQFNFNTKAYTVDTLSGISVLVNKIEVGPSVVCVK